MIVDDEAGVRQGIESFLTQKGYETLSVASADEALAVIDTEVPDLILLDLNMPGKDGFHFLRNAGAKLSKCIIVILSAYADIDKAVEATKLGADRVIEKPIPPSDLEAQIRELIPTDPSEVVPDNRGVLPLHECPIDLVTASQSMQKVRQQILLAAGKERARVLIQGESGTGKEIVARAIWEKSQENSGPFVDVNCAALSENLLEAELFGHEKGAFTGAETESEGLFEAADGGVIFLDEIGEMPVDLQPKLLRVLEEKKFKRVGGTQNIEADFRVIASTNRQLGDMVQNGQFRRDLFYRLNVLPIYLPPLRERKDDIPPLARRILWQLGKTHDQHIDGFSEEALDKLHDHCWPGNVRELRNVVERAALLAPGNTITEDLIVFSDSRSDCEQPELECTSIEEMEQKLIRRVLEDNNWHKKKSAEVLGINRTTLWNKIKSYGIEEDDRG